MQANSVAGVVDSLEGLSDSALLELVEASVARLGSVALTAGVDDDGLRGRVAALQRCESMVHAAKLRCIAEVDARKAFRAAAQRSTADWVASVCGLTAGEARQQARNAGVLGRLPLTAAQLADGAITPGHVAAAAQGLADLDRVAADRRQAAGDDVDAWSAAVEDAQAMAAAFDGMVAAAAVDRDRVALAKTITGWTAQREPDAITDRERRAMARRGIHLAGQRNDDGLWDHRLRLTDAVNAQFLAALGPLARKTSADDDRTPTQRRHDALATMAQLAGDHDAAPGATGARAQVLVIRDEPEPAAASAPSGASAPPAHVDGLGPVSSATAALFACDADTTVVRRDPASRRIWDVGHANGDPSRAQRAAVIARDRGCVGCAAPATRCHIHHIRWRRHGGTTTVDNLVLVCWSCHQGIHHLHWTVSGNPHTGFTINRHPNPAAHTPAADTGAGAADTGAGGADQPPDL